MNISFPLLLTYIFPKVRASISHLEELLESLCTCRHKKHPNLERISVRVYLSQIDGSAGKQRSQMLWRRAVCSFFCAEGGSGRQITWRWGRGRSGLGYRTVSSILCSLEAGEASEGSEKWACQRCANPEGRQQWAGLAEGRDRPLLKKFHAWGMSTHCDLPSQEFVIRQPREVTSQRTPSSSTHCIVVDNA